MAKKGLTGNASNFKDIKFAEKVEQLRAQRYESALRAVLNTSAGRIVFAQIMRQCGLYRSIWSPNVDIHFNAGKQEAALELRHQLQAVDDLAFDQMDAEERAWLREQRQLQESNRTPAAGHARTQDDTVDDIADDNEE